MLVAIATLLACGPRSDKADSVAVVDTARVARVAAVQIDTGALGTDASIAKDSCEGESCWASYPAVACVDVNLVASPTGRGDAGSLKRGDTVAVRTDMYFKEPGRVILKRAHSVTDESVVGGKARLRFAAGDTILLTTYIGNEMWKGTYKGKPIRLVEFWGGPGAREMGPNDRAQAALAEGTVPVIEKWLRLSKGGRVIGWSLSDDWKSIIPIGEYGQKWGFECPQEKKFLYGWTPTVAENSCEGEGCEASFRAVACKEVRLFVSPTEMGTAGFLDRGDTVEARLDIHTSAPGLVILKRAHTITDANGPLRFAANDTFLLTRYVAEGEWQALFRERRFTVTEFWGGPGKRMLTRDTVGNDSIATATPPLTEYWVRVSRGERVLGWWPADDAQALVKLEDGCGET
jgi:hypothetical protein